MLLIRDSGVRGEAYAMPSRSTYMSMSEFERQENTEGNEPFPVAMRRPPTPPDDFTEEDLAFARELNALFSLEEENLPPYYVQTLLDVEDQRFEPACSADLSAAYAQGGAPGDRTALFDDAGGETGAGQDLRRHRGFDSHRVHARSRRDERRRIHGRSARALRSAGAGRRGEFQPGA